MAEYSPLKADETGQERLPSIEVAAKRKGRPNRVTSLDVFRGLCVVIMMLVDYGGPLFPSIGHSPWDGVHLADFVMPSFLFVSGISLALVFKNVSDRVEASQKSLMRALKLFLYGVILQGGYLHGTTSLTYGVDIGRLRWMGILQRISIGYAIAALCEIWLPTRKPKGTSCLSIYLYHWCTMCALLVLYLALTYGLYVPDWQFQVLSSTSSLVSSNSTTVYKVSCSRRGDLGPACNAAGMIDRYVLGINHLYKKPVYRNLKDTFIVYIFLQECGTSGNQHIVEISPSWCLAPFDPEGILSSLSACVSSIMGLQFGHILVQLQDHKERLQRWFLYSVALCLLGLFLCILGVPLNKSLYSVSYMLVTTGAAGMTFSFLYLLVDVYGFRRLTNAFEWMGKHALNVFILVSSNLAVIAIQGFYYSVPENNIVR
ncbi:heparan-alpha-glucosaminide N-acetyltransferase-like [Impatiens glandulifera]|uniref:heparan-alpha-glucosaminide N-acetyltransferase-like n=1 Tax=Impatiens glandulifera TaxID=253017 RepID=UPI001FB12DDF|nr:heparan-alpha-glucosaminide N-acetyltransferase-like [Impatiens glandulifera]